MHFKIHRGANEIGGTCIEIWTETGHVVLDIGMPLVNPDKSKFDSSSISNLSKEQLIATGVLPDIPGLFIAKGEKEFGVVLSHAHQDHFGLAGFIHRDCKFYLGAATHKLIDLTGTFSHGSWNINHFHHFKSGEPFMIGDLEFTPYLMDHSAFDAYAFLVKSNGRTLFYSGDFRHHGRKAKVFDWFTHHIEQNIDYLLMEGTTIGRPTGKFKSEEEIESEFENHFRENKGITFIYTSGQNIDRIVSVYKACKRAQKILAVDFYIANVLKELSIFNSLPFPSSTFPEIRVFFPFRLAKMILGQGKPMLLYRFSKYKITKNEIRSNPEKIVMIVRPSMQKDIHYLKNIEGGRFIYSMWEGYLQEDKTRVFVDYLASRGLSIHNLHTSGHADEETLKRMVDAIRPKSLVPIHTFNGAAYQKIFPDVNVRLVKNGEVVEI
ncbi:MAG: MBL fold metallo-hydrolase [bacterium]